MKRLPSTTLITAPSWMPSMELSSARLSSVMPPSWREKHVRWQVISCSISTWCSSATSSWPDTWEFGLERFRKTWRYSEVFQQWRKNWQPHSRTWSWKLSVPGGWILTVKPISCRLTMSRMLSCSDCSGQSSSGSSIWLGGAVNNRREKISVWRWNPAAWQGGSFSQNLN